MNTKYKSSCAALLIGSVFAASSASAEVYTLADFTRTASGASTTTNVDFDPNGGWSGTPSNTTSGVVYLTTTVSWAATASNFGTFSVQFNQNDAGGAGRFGMGTEGSGFALLTGNSSSDPDGAGPATVKPTILAVDKNTTMSVTLVMRVDHGLAGTTPGGDYWFADAGLQSSALGFMYIDPNLGATEASQFTPWAAWRSGNASYSGVGFRSDTDAVDLNFSNIAVYTDGDTPFSAVSEPSGPVNAAQSMVEATDAVVNADGTTTTITVTLRDANSIVISGEDVTLSNAGSAVIGSPVTVTTDGSGQAIFTVSSNTVAIEEFVATVITSSNLEITQRATVDFQEVVMAGPVDASNSSVAASPTSVLANGITTSTVTVTLRDSNGLLVAGEGVTLNGSPATITPSGAQTTDANGQADFTVSSGTVGLVAFAATSVTDNVTVSQTADVDFIDPQSAEAFNVNFNDEGQASATGLVGVVGNPGEIWNQGTTSVSNLIDTTGTVVSSVSVSGLGSDGRTLNADLSVFGGVRDLFDKGGDVTISITGLTPDAAYDLYIYSLSHSAGPWGDVANTERAAGDFVTTNTVNGNGQSQFLDNGTQGTSDSNFVPGGNYVAFESIIADGSGNISIVVDAYDGTDENPATNDGDTRLHVNGLQIRPASGMSADYTAWRDAYYPGIGLPDEDDDGDSLSNEYERTFGLDPTDSASTNPYWSPFDPTTGSFGYTRRTSSLINMNYKVWYSTDLDQWFEDNAANQLPASVINDVEFMSVGIDPNLLSEPRIFVQVRDTLISGVDPEPSLVNLWGSGDTITLLFSEPMNPSSAGNLDNYTVVQDGAGTLSITGAALSGDGGSVTLSLASALGTDTGYTVNIDGVTSGTGQSLGIGVSRQFTTWDDDPTGIKVFILAGQSNMVGRGSVEGGNSGSGTLGSLRFMAVNNVSYPDYDYASLLDDPGQPTTSAFANRADVKVWWRDGGNGSLGGAIRKGDLGPPYQGSDSGKIGPEYAFGQVIGDYYASDNVLVIKCAWGGRDLAEKFRPPSAVANRGGQVGEFYSATIDQTREVLNNLGTEFPEWSGQGYEIVGFAWHQGYNDRISTAFSAEYKDNLPDLINDVREVFNKPNLPFVIATTGMAVGSAEAAPYSGYTEVEKAQLWASGVDQPANVLSSDTRPFWRDPANSPATTGQGFHWNYNAESLFLIGKALGDDMVNLLTTP